MFSSSSLSALPLSSISITVAPILITGGFGRHDEKKQKKQFEKEIARRFKNKNEIIRAFERIIEGRPDVAEEIITPFIFTEKLSTSQNINYDKLALDVDRIEKIWKHFIELDDEDVLTLL